MKINVTKKDIKYAKPGSQTLCPIANALRRKHPKSKLADIKVMPEHVFIYGEQADLPKTARRFIHKFDTGLKVAPFSFEMEG